MSPLHRLGPALRTVAAVALVVLTSGALVRAIDAAFDPFQPYPGDPYDYGVARTRAIRAALPEIADRPEKATILVASSGLARAFVPSVFDAARGNAAGQVSFNLGEPLLQPETTLAMAKVTRRTFEARGKRLGVTLFGISIPELNRDFLRAARRKLPDQAFTFASADFLAERARTDPFGALGDGLSLVVFGNVRPSRVGLWLEDWASARPLGCDSGLKQPPEGREAYETLVSFCAELDREFPRGVPPWDPTTRGGFDFGLPATRPMLTRLVELQRLPDPPPPASPTARGTPDDIDEDAVRMLIEAARELSAVSDHTIILRDLFNPAFLASVPPSRLAQWRDVAERIAHAADAPLLDLNDGSFVPADFGDRTHLNPLAAERFSSLLVTRLRPIVQEHRASR